MSEGLIINALNKSFGALQVLKDISLKVEPKEIFGILGLNGAGKTTMFKCLLNLIKADSGEILYNDKPVTTDIIHKHIGYLPEFYLPPAELTGYEYLKFLKMSVKNCETDINSLLNRTKLSPDKRIGDYSRGMIQRLGVAVALLKDPEFIILDEPTLGLDPLAKKNLLDWLVELNKQGKTILLSSHDFTQVSKVCTKIAVLNNHCFTFSGTIEQFLTKHSTNCLEEAFLIETGAIKDA